jgi:hypothetical protein
MHTYPGPAVAYASMPPALRTVTLQTLQDLAEMHGVSGGEGEVWSADGPPKQAPKRTEWPELVGKDAVLARG